MLLFFNKVSSNFHMFSSIMLDWVIGDDDREFIITK